jgi:hypothetical protein
MLHTAGSWVQSLVTMRFLLEEAAPEPVIIHHQFILLIIIPSLLHAYPSLP